MVVVSSRSLTLQEIANICDCNYDCNAFSESAKTLIGPKSAFEMTVLNCGYVFVTIFDILGNYRHINRNCCCNEFAESSKTLMLPKSPSRTFFRTLFVIISGVL